MQIDPRITTNVVKQDDGCDCRRPHLLIVTHSGAIVYQVVEHGGTLPHEPALGGVSLTDHAPLAA